MAALTNNFLSNFSNLVKILNYINTSPKIVYNLFIKFKKTLRNLIKIYLQWTHYYKHYVMPDEALIFCSN